MFTPKFRWVQVAQEDTPLHETIVQRMDMTQRHSLQQSWGHSSISLSLLYFPLLRQEDIVPLQQHHT